MKIEFYKKNVYGNELMYLKDELQADWMSRILGGQKTISSSQMELFTALFGVTFIQVLN